MEVRAVDGELASPASPISTVAVAVNGKKNCKSAVKWALEKFAPGGRSLFKLLHIRARVTMVPTEMGNYIPISNVRDEVVSAYKKEIEWKTNAMFLPYKQMCTQKKVEAEAVVIESDDIADAISQEIAKFSIGTLVIGASSRSMLRRKLRGCDVSSRISECIPSFCTVYVISKGSLLSVRTSTSESERSYSNISSDSYFSSTSCLETGTSSALNHFHSSSLADQRYQALLTINQAVFSKRSSPVDTYHSRSLSLSTEEDAMSSSSSSSEVKYGGSITSSSRSCQADSQSWNSDRASVLDTLTDSSLSESKVDISYELEKLRIELRHVQGIYAMAQNEKTDASRELNELSRRRMEESVKLKEIHFREEKAWYLARQEKEKIEATKREAELVRECAEREAVQRKAAEIKAARDTEEKQKLEKALISSDQQYKKFTWEEIVSATSSFSDDLKIGMGGYGMVYKCNLHHTTAAVKVLHDGQRTKQFEQELEILSRIRHPHLLLLLGACPEHGCLVYEYMEHGSLDDRLLQKDNTPPIPWFDRYRIAREVASTLLYLHNSKPRPIVHRDLKPANILLDRNFVSKIGDVGLSTLLPPSGSMSTMGKETAPMGTFCYIDPEYQRTGLVSPKSDVYSFGMVILQLLTAKPPLALTDIVERALEEGRLVDILDSKAGKWPIEETQELAALGLRCAELRRRDRPDLKDDVLPMLERLIEVADGIRELVSLVPAPPNHFICPILQDVMNDPCVAADGYTYERGAIDLWLSVNDKSPMTNAPLPHKNLIPNYSLLSAIMEWKAKHQ